MIQFELPQDVEADLRERFGDLNEVARDAFLIQNYREGRLSVGQIGAILGIGVLGAEHWLFERKVPLNYSLKELEEDRETLARVLSGASRK